MIITNYGLILIAILGISGLGYTFGAQTLFVATVISLGIVGMISDIASVFMPAAIKYIFFAAFGLGLLFHLKTRMAAFRNASITATDALLLVSLIFLFRHLNSNFYFFESGDILYFGTSLEMLLADYLSPLRLFTYYPEEMTAFHKLPSGIVAYALIFFDQPTLIDAVDARFTIIIFSLFLFFRALTKHNSVLLYLFFFSVLTIYGEEMSYEFTISSYFYIIVLFGLAYTLHIKKEPPQVFVLLLMILICAKAPIFYSAFMCAIVSVSIFWDRLNKAIILGFAVGVAAVILSWTAIPPPINGQSFTSYLYWGFTEEGARTTLNNVQGWFLSDPIVLAIQTYFRPLPPIGVYLLMSLFILKIYVIGALVIGAIGKEHNIGVPGRHPATQQQMTFVIFLYLVASLAGYLWLRNGLSISHQAHGPLIAAGLVAALCCVWGAHQTDVRRLLWAPLLMIVFLPNSGKLEIPNAHTTRAIGSSPQKDIWTTAKPLPTVRKNAKTYQPGPSELMIDSQLHAALLGLRLTTNDAPSVPAAGVNPFWSTGGGK